MTPIDTTGPDGILDILRSIEGVVDAFYTDRAFLDSILEEERDIIASGGVPTRNEGLIQVIARKHAITAVTTSECRVGVDEPTIELRSSDGKLLGTQIVASNRSLYADRPDAIYISDDFVMFADDCVDNDQIFVMPPVSFPALGPEEGCLNTVCCFP